MSIIRRLGGAILIALFLTQPSWGGEPPKESRSAKASVDLYGDPLPAGAIARLGFLRFRRSESIRAVAFSEDGKLLAASCFGLRPYRVVIWERATGRKLREFPAGGFPIPPAYLRFSANGKRLYGSSPDSRNMRIYAWDVASGANATDIPPLPAGVRAFGYSPDAREFIFLDKEREIVRWDIEKGKERGRYPKPDHDNSIAALVGERLLVPQFDGQAAGMWDAVQKKQLWSVKTTRDKNYPAVPMAFSADGKLFAVEAPPRVISVYDSVTGKIVCRFKEDVGEVYYSVCISPDGRTIVASNRDGSLRLWDLESGRQRAKTPPGQGWFSISFAPDSKIFEAGGLWDTANGKRIDPFPGHFARWVSFSPDGRTAATAAEDDPAVWLWDTQMLLGVDRGRSRCMGLERAIHRGGRRRGAIWILA